jgi:hypothetical protein
VRASKQAGKWREKRKEGKKKKKKKKKSEREREVTRQGMMNFFNVCYAMFFFLKFRPRTDNQNKK